MARYEKQTWVNKPNSTTPLSAGRLNKLETQFDRAIESVADDINAPTSGIGAALRGSVTTELGTPASGIGSAVDGRVTTAATRAVMHKMINGRPVICTAIGDSTTIYTTSWYDGLMTWLASQYPAFTYARREWDTDAEVYKPVTIVQAGPSGRRRLVATNATTDHFFTIADSAQVSPTGDHRIEVKLKMPSVLPAAGIPLAGKWNSAGNQRGWFFQHNGASGTLSLWYSTDGVNQTQVNSTAALPTSLDGMDVWLRADLDVDNGAAGKDIKFWYSTDDRATWTQLGATVTSAGVITVFDNTLPLQFVGRSAAVVAMPSWEFYEFRLYDNIAGTGAPRAHIDLLAWDWYGPFSDLAGNIVTVSGTTGRVGSPTLYSFNGGAPGQTISYANDSGRFPKLAAPTASDLVFINFSHNESTVDTFRADVATLVGNIAARWADTGFVIVGQNPRTAPLSASNIAKHEERVARIITYAAAQRHAVIDAYRALKENTALYVATDGIHPTQAGYNRWRDEAKKLFSPWQIRT